MKKNQLAAVMAAGLLVMAGGLYLVWSKPVDSIKDDIKLSTPPPREAEVGFHSLVIDPAKYESGWWAYKSGAKLIIEASGFNSVLVKGFPTGTGVGEDFPDGLSLGEAKLESGSQTRWSFLLPDGMLLTNLWAEGVATDGRVIKSPDLGNVGYDE